jgi:hypothetical protein
MSQEMNKHEKPTIGKNENVTTTPELRGDKPAEIIYREIRIVEPSAELVQELKNKEKPITGLGHDKIKHKGLEHDKPLGDKIKDKGFEHDKPLEHASDKYGAGKPVHDLGHDDGPRVKSGPADLPDKLHGERLTDKTYSDAPKHDKDAYVGNKPEKLDGDRHVGDKHRGPDEQRYVGSDKHLAYPAEPTEFKEAKHIGDKYHSDKGKDLGQNLGQGYDDGATRKYVEKPLSPREKSLSPRDKHIDGDKHHLGKKHAKHHPAEPVEAAEFKEAKHVGDKYHSDKGKDLGQNLGQEYDDGATQEYVEKPLSPRDKHVDGDKHLLGKKHKHKKDDAGKKHKLHLLGGKKHEKDEPVVGDKLPKTHEHVVVDQHPKTHEHTVDKHKLKDGDVVAHGEKVKDKHQLKEADHIGDKYISKKGWDLGQNLGKKYDDADSYKLTDGHQYVPGDKRDVLRPEETVTVPADERVPPAPAIALPTAPAAPPVAPAIPARASDERIVVPSAHGERVYGHELKDGDRHVGDKHLAREDDILGDEHRKDKHLKDKDYVTQEADESQKKPNVIVRAIEKVKEKLSSKSSTAETTGVDPNNQSADKGHQWEKVPDKHDSGDVHWKDRGVAKADKHKSTY